MSIAEQTWRWLTAGSTWSGSGSVPFRLAEHLVLTVVSVALAAAIALPLTLWLGHVGRGGWLAAALSNVGRAVPVFAVLALFATIDAIGFGNRAAVLALVLFAIPPIVTNGYTGMREVDRDVVDAATGMGMSGRQVFARVEVPLAAPLILTGLRTATVQVIATATIAALVGGGGLGRFIVDGFGLQDYGQIVGGALVVAVLAIGAEFALGAGERALSRRLGLAGGLSGPAAALTAA